jgi:hypothetical protein
MGKVREIDGDQEQFWRMAIETWQASGLSVSQFCQNEGLSKPQFYMWRKKLTGGNVEHEDHVGSKPAPFIEVAIPESKHITIELMLRSGNTMRIYPGIDSVTLDTALSSLHRAGLC